MAQTPELQTDRAVTRANFASIDTISVSRFTWISNYHLWYAAIWTLTIVLYTFQWSDLNQSLDPQLIAFFVLTIFTSLVLGLVRQLRTPTFQTFARRRPLAPSAWWTLCLLVGFASDFAYRGGIPLLSGHYAGYDVTEQIQETVGIPVLHVILIAFAIFQSGVLAQAWLELRKGRLVVQIVVIQCMLLLNYSRGYMVFSMIIILLLVMTRLIRSGKSYIRPAIVSVVVTFLILLGIGAMGNVRSGDAWNDTTNIDSIGLFNSTYPDFLSSQLKWTYTYLTSPLANLNYNFSLDASSSNIHLVALAVLPQTLTKHALAGYMNHSTIVTYLNAATGFMDSLATGGLVGMYLFYVLVAVLLAIGRTLAFRLHQVEYFDCTATLLVIVLVFMNSFANTATCFLIPLVLSRGLLMWRRQHASQIDRKESAALLEKANESLSISTGGSGIQ